MTYHSNNNYMETILGLAMIYAWVHSIVIVSIKTKDTTAYEKGVLLFGVTAFALYIFGTI